MEKNGKMKILKNGEKWENEDFYKKNRQKPCRIKNKSYLCIRNRKGEAQNDTKKEKIGM